MFNLENLLECEMKKTITIISVLVLFGLLFLNPTLAFVGLVIFGLFMKFVSKK